MTLTFFIAVIFYYYIYSLLELKNSNKCIKVIINMKDKYLKINSSSGQSLIYWVLGKTMTFSHQITGEILLWVKYVYIFKLCKYYTYMNICVYI